MSTSFDALPGSAQDLFVGDSLDEDVKNAFDRFKHIVDRYEFDNFAGADLSPSKLVPTTIETNKDNTVLIVIIVSLAAALSLGGYLLIEKKRRNASN